MIRAQNFNLLEKKNRFFWLLVLHQNGKKFICKNVWSLCREALWKDYCIPQDPKHETSHKYLNLYWYKGINKCNISFFNYEFNVMSVSLILGSYFPVVSGLCPRKAAFLSLPWTCHRVLPEAEAGDAERDAAAGGPRTRDHGGRGQQRATTPWPGQQGQRIPGNEDSRWVDRDIVEL